jgi:hypothetical protein
MDSFSVEMEREYISYLQTVNRYEGHPFKPYDETRMSSANVRNHVGVLRSFSSWLEREEYTPDNILGRLKVPKAAQHLDSVLPAARSSSPGGGVHFLPATMAAPLIARLAEEKPPFLRGLFISLPPQLLGSA